MKREQLLAPAVFGFLVHCAGLPDLPARLADNIMRAWSIDQETFDRLLICGYPTRVENFIAANEAAARFGDLSTVPGFYKHNDCWFMDLDDRYCETGFILPRIDRRYGWIFGLTAFRNVKDSQGFAVQVRKGTRKAA